MRGSEGRRNQLLGAALGAALAYAPGAWAFIDIVFDYSYDTSSFFSGNTTATSLLDEAAGYFESIIQDDFTAIESDADSGGPNNFTAVFTNPSTGTSESISNFDVAANTVTVFVGGSSTLGGALGVGGPGGYSVSGTQAFLDNAISRGEGDGTAAAVDGAGATDFALWGGSISFDSMANWYFDPDTSTDGDVPSLVGGRPAYDFYSVALHELGHVLGVGTASSWVNKIDTANGTFTGANATAANGGTAVALADPGHWADGTLSTVNGNPQEAAMDPTIANGQRKRFTELDNAALADIGWEVQTASP